MGGCEYGPWLSRFAIGLFLRLAVIHEYRDPPTRGDRAIKKWALPAWRTFLLGSSEWPGEFEVHLLPLGLIERSTDRLAENMPFYLTRSADMNYVESESRQRAFFMALLPRLLFVCPLVPRRDEGWVGTRIRGSGTFTRRGGFTVGIPGLMEYLNERVEQISQLTAGDERTRELRSARFLRDPERVLRSDSLKAARVKFRLGR